MKGNPLWSPEQEAQVKANLERIKAERPELKFVEAIAEAQQFLPEDLRRQIKYPSGVPWLVREAGKKRCAQAKGKAAVKRSGPKTTANAAHRAAATPADALTIDDAVQLLADVIVGNVAAKIGPQIESIVAKRIAATAIKLAPKAESAQRADATPKGLRGLSDSELRLELIKAKCEGDSFRVKKIVAEYHRRDAGANIIERESQDES
jgi:hypothetical protein